MMTFPESRRRLFWTTCLAAIAIAGVLLMHGLDAAAVDLVGSGPNDRAHDHGPVIHGVIGLCVFVVAAAGLALSNRRSTGQQNPPPTVPQTVSSTGIDTASTTGRLRLLQLCILRA
jgi:hypothetical protein